jgi:hypothetical protein
MSVSISNKVYPEDSTTVVRWTAIGSYLPAPTSTLAEQVVLCNVTTGIGPQIPCAATEPRHIGLTTNQSITVVVSIDGISLNVDELTLLLSTVDGFYIGALNGLGEPILDHLGNPKTLNWDAIAPFVAYTSKSSTALSGFLPACINHEGCDGFSISVSVLRNLMSGSGYTLSLPFHVRVQTGAGASRRLLAVGDPIISGVISGTFNITDGVITQITSTLDRDLGDPAKGVSVLLFSGSQFVFGLALAGITSRLVGVSVSGPIAK